MARGVRGKALGVLLAGALVATQVPARPAHAEVNCANLFTQAGGAAVGLFAQVFRLIQQCKDGWDRRECIVQGVVVVQALVWFWWTSSSWYCEPACFGGNQAYCALFGLVPRPPNPNQGGGQIAPVGPKLPGGPVAIIDTDAGVLAEP